MLAGRSGCLSHGFDVAELVDDPDAAIELVSAGAELLLRLFANPMPVVIACTGSARAAGALLLLTARVRCS